jgi:selenocysteine lyase/cysteine desulfurase
LSASYKRLFSRALQAAPGRLHMAAHSHHLWPDVTRDAQMQAWEDAARLADRKWDHVFDAVYPSAQANVARELRLPSPATIAFAPNTHALILRLFSATEKRPLRVLTSDGEFHSFRRQAARWAEAGLASIDVVTTEPGAAFEERFLQAARNGAHDLVFVSHVFFKTGRVFEAVWELAQLARPCGPFVVIDGYHGFMALPTDLGAVADRVFYLAGGYKYAMAGEGAAFLHAPPGFAMRPVDTGWFAEFGDLEGTASGAPYAKDASRFLGATFDPSGLYRLNAVFAMLAAEGLDTAAVAVHVQALRLALVEAIAAGRCGRLAEAEMLNPGSPARFVALKHAQAGAWKAALDAAGVMTDHRDDVLRIGLGLYHDAEDVERFAEIAARALR